MEWNKVSSLDAVVTPILVKYGEILDIVSISAGYNEESLPWVEAINEKIDCNKQKVSCVPFDADRQVTVQWSKSLHKCHWMHTVGWTMGVMSASRTACLAWHCSPCWMTAFAAWKHTYGQGPIELKIRLNHGSLSHTWPYLLILSLLSTAWKINATVKSSTRSVSTRYFVNLYSQEIRMRE